MISTLFVSESGLHLNKILICEFYCDYVLLKVLKWGKKR